MKKWMGLFFLVVMLSGFAAHKFYVSIYQVHFNPQKKRLEITTRIFMDDLNSALGKRFNKKTHMGESGQTASDVALFCQYLDEKFRLSVDAKRQVPEYLSSEIEGNVVVCYFRISGVTKYRKLDLYNAALMELNDTQQNIIQYSKGEARQSLLLTADNPSGQLN